MSQRLPLQIERGIQLHFIKREKLLIMSSLFVLTMSTLLMLSSLATKASGLCSTKLAGLQWIIKTVSYLCQLVVGRASATRSANSMFCSTLFFFLMLGVQTLNTSSKLLFLQLPATLHQGVTVVVCPLLSLIQDQIVALTYKFAIPAAFLNSQQTPAQASAVIQELR